MKMTRAEKRAELLRRLTSVPRYTNGYLKDHYIQMLNADTFIIVGDRTLNMLLAELRKGR